MSARRIVQAVSLVLLNPFPANLFKGRIFDGWSKRLCVPALNCYSCPAAFGACPIGSMQVTVAELKRYAVGVTMAAAAWAAIYVAAFIAAVGAVAGRFPCGWICPFGFLQELVHFRRRDLVTLRAPARWPKYAFLVVFVVLLPLFESYPTSPRFCALVCPAGTLEAGLPLVAHDRLLGAKYLSVGLLFAWKVLLAVFFLGGATLISRFFCRTACPLGAAWGLMNRVSLVALEVDRSACTLCGFCRTVCPVDIYVYEEPNASECVRCLKCRACPQGAVRVILRPFGKAPKI